MTPEDHLAYLARRRRVRLAAAIIVPLLVISLALSLRASGRRRWLAGASLPDLQVAARQDPNDSDAIYALACRLIDDDRCPDARPLLERLVRQHPRDAEYHYTLARIYDAVGRPDLALAAYRETATLDPKRPRVYVGMGVILAGAGLLTDGLHEFDRAYALDPNGPMDYDKWVRCLVARGRLSEAFDRLYYAMHKNPANETRFAQLTDVGLRLGRSTDVEALLRKRIQAFRGYPSDVVRGALIRLLLTRPRSRATLAEIDRIAAGAFSPAGVKPDFDADYAAALIAQGRLDRARNLLNDGLRWIPTHVACLTQLARVEELSGRTAEAARIRKKLSEITHETPGVAALRRAVASAPADSEERLRLAAGAAEAGNPGEAAEQCHEVLRLRPGDPTASKLLDQYRAQAIQRLAERETAASLATVAQQVAAPRP